MVGTAAWTLIFGGCCSNVFTLESIVKHEPDSGLVITVTQFILTSLFALPSQLEPTSPPSSSGSTKPGTRKSLLPWRLRPPVIPLERLAIMSLMFFTVNMLNNWAFAFSISVPMHIILRSFGSVQTLVVGWLAGKTYSRVQVGAVAALTVGVIVSAWADASAKGANLSLLPNTSSSSSTSTASSYASGLLILFTAQLISAWMGIYTETTYARHGRHWREILFYSHALGLVFSAALYATLARQARRLLAGPPASVPELLREQPLFAAATHGLQRLAILPVGFGGSLPRSLVLLFLNGATQVACISGVNLLSAQTTAVTVTVVLNIRKLVSFLLSCLLFGNPVTGKMAVGAAIVFASGAVYGWDETSKKAAARRKGGVAEGKANGVKKVGVDGLNGSVRDVNKKVD